MADENAEEQYINYLYEKFASDIAQQPSDSAGAEETQENEQTSAASKQRKPKGAPPSIHAVSRTDMEVLFRSLGADLKSYTQFDASYFDKEYFTATVRQFQMQQHTHVKEQRERFASAINGLAVDGLVNVRDLARALRNVVPEEEAAELMRETGLQGEDVIDTETFLQMVFD